MKYTITHLMAFFWKEFNTPREEFYNMWLPYIKLMFERHIEVFHKSKKDSNVRTYDTDSMSIDRVKAFFRASGFPVSEE